MHQQSITHTRPIPWLSPTDIQRFWDYVLKTADCWYWFGYRFPTTGYGGLRVGSKKTGTRRMVLTHRLSYELHRGPIPDGLLACHTCDNPACCRPDHLFLGTHLDNVQDMDRKGRRVRKGSPGALNPRAVLDPDKAREIFDRYIAGGIGHVALAREYSVSRTTIWRVVHSNHWALPV